MGRGNSGKPKRKEFFIIGTVFWNEIVLLASYSEPSTKAISGQAVRAVNRCHTTRSEPKFHDLPCIGDNHFNHCATGPRTTMSIMIMRLDCSLNLNTFSFQTLMRKIKNQFPG